MELARITTRGQTTIPKRIREAAGLHEGDHLIVRKVTSEWNDYLRDLSEGLGEWESPADEEAWRDLWAIPYKTILELSPAYRPCSPNQKRFDLST